MESQRNTIAFDTNVLVSIAKTKKDVLEEAKKEFGTKSLLEVPEQVIAEVNALERKGKAMKKACALAKKLLELHGVKTKKIFARNADSALLAMARHGAIVITNDRELKKRIKKSLGKIIELSRGRLRTN